jgi:hypothetical protein
MIRLFTILLALIVCSISDLSAQKTSRIKEVKFVYPEFVLVGSTKDNFKNRLSEIDEYAEARFHKNTAIADLQYESAYEHSIDVRINKQMFLATYEYLFKNDSCFTLRIKPGTWNNWQSEVLKDHDFVNDKNIRPDKIAHHYISKDKSYRLSIYEVEHYGTKEYYMQAFKN